MIAGVIIQMIRNMKATGRWGSTADAVFLQTRITCGQTHVTAFGGGGNIQKQPGFSTKKSAVSHCEIGCFFISFKD
jgi:hypothetical protein